MENMVIDDRLLPPHPPPPPSDFIVDRPKALFCFDSLVFLDAVCGYNLLFLLHIKIENM